MMKQLSLFAGLFAGFSLTFGPVVQAVDFNAEAMKSMQKEGHQIVEDSQQGRIYKSAGGHCLDKVGAGLVVKKCNAKVKTQRWRLDNKKRLVASDGRCVAGAKLQKCGSGKAQVWKLDGQKRLANNAKQCLQAQGNPPKAGAKVVVADCNKAPNQVWK